jgi:hypothetical protein
MSSQNRLAFFLYSCQVSISFDYTQGIIKIFPNSYNKYKMTCFTPNRGMSCLWSEKTLPPNVIYNGYNEDCVLMLKKLESVYGKERFVIEC